MYLILQCSVASTKFKLCIDIWSYANQQGEFFFCYFEVLFNTCDTIRNKNMPIYIIHKSHHIAPQLTYTIAESFLTITPGTSITTLATAANAVIIAHAALYKRSPYDYKEHGLEAIRQDAQSETTQHQLRSASPTPLQHLPEQSQVGNRRMGGLLHHFEHSHGIGDAVGGHRGREADGCAVK
jgi:hypothetical protein